MLARHQVHDRGAGAPAAVPGAAQLLERVPAPLVPLVGVTRHDRPIIDRRRGRDGNENSSHYLVYTRCVEALTAPFELPYVQRGVAEVLLLSAGAGVLGCWIVLRGLSFYAHAVGTAAFPGPRAGRRPRLRRSARRASLPRPRSPCSSSRSSGRERLGPDVATALGLAGMLALGVILASDVFGSGARRRVAAVRQPAAGRAARSGGRRRRPAPWRSAPRFVLRAGVARERLRPRRAAGSLGVRSRAFDAVLLALVALVVTAALSGARRAAGGRAARGAGGDRAAVDQPPARLAGGDRRAGRARGHRRAVAVGQAERPARRHDRDAVGRRVRGGGARAVHGPRVRAGRGRRRRPARRSS